jgi:hypothetical protein
MALKNLTPPKFICGLGNCPAVYAEDDGKHLRIIGKCIDPGELAGRISSDETIIRVEREMLHNVGGPLSRLFMRIGL